MGAEWHFCRGMLGLFLLGLISRKAKNTEAVIATVIGIILILWMTFSPRLDENYVFLKNGLHKNMIIVVGTMGIFLTGTLLTKIRKAQS